MMPTDFAKNISDFLGEYLPAQRNVSLNTIKSYRDTFKLLLTFANNYSDIPTERITLKVLNHQFIEDFLMWLEIERKNGIATRNQRLAGIHSFFRYLQIKEPVQMFSYQQVLAIPFKKSKKKMVSHLTPDALKLILDQPDCRKASGRRNLAILSVLYDTGARVQELIDLRVRDIRLDEPPIISLTGKGSKTRHVPLMPNTKSLLEKYMSENQLLHQMKHDHPLFYNRQNNKMTRVGISYIVNKYVEMAKTVSPIIPEKVTPHLFRHTKAMHLLQAGVNLIYIRDLLGHVDISTTEIYARADTELKRKALEDSYPNMVTKDLPEWSNDNNLLSWLKSL